MAALREIFRPEFLNRIDDIVLFSPLGKDQIEHIIDLQMQHLVKRLGERQITLQLTAAAKALLFARRLRSGVRRAADEARHPAADSGSAGAEDSRRRSESGRYVKVDADAKSGEMKFYARRPRRQAPR